ncbi:MAG: hypothetical protein QOI04_1410 [Verrucomicrobiota bacterium]|jgi:hypothetical protein
MDDFNENEIGKLLRLKRFEQPPPAYFDNFLHEFHRRQRDELLRQPLWRICLDRAQGFVAGFNLTTLVSYPAAVTAVLVLAAVISLKVYQTPNQVNVAAQERASSSAAPARANAEWKLGAAPVATRDISAPLFRTVNESAYTHRAAAAPPRYVLDNTPVSYEAAFRF